ncbi:hypothetical protein AU162_gp024 [Pseudomonas phage YMC11/02/R656]|uniref:Uncharacterized protein n=1 Tax=Pseudomonas phage YMC11/02/R656 TaxID=1755689 RepID=A0A0S2SYB5_9CAUD|nr:hypothetical protein [Pseudomonas aeruginosa]YP_009187421.1 hypothetical protein AU162_gp024 [Pseudomonas phage YMC11/02/R656]ALP47845.1 hypothetical protein BPPAER656_00240 [Pseudomonas phage YMC11/02/R656]
MTEEEHDAKLRAEAQALREEVARGNRITLAMALDIAAVGVALGIPGEQQEGGTGEFIEAIQSLQKELEALRARVVVPDGYALMPLEPSPEMRLASHRYKRKNKVSTGPGFWRAMAEAAPRLNGLTVSEGLLRLALEFIMATNCQGSIPLGLIEELRALLNQDKENGDHAA